jgi:hypothetical protein
MPSGSGFQGIITIDGVQVQATVACDTRRGAISVHYMAQDPNYPTYTVADGTVILFPIPATVTCESADSLRAFAVEQYPNRV